MNGSVPKRLRLDGDLDLSRRNEIERLLFSHLETGSIEIDLSGATFMDSTVISALIKALKAYRSRGHDVVLIAPSPGVTKLLSITGLSRVFTIRDAELTRPR